MADDPISVAKQSFQAYVDSDRAAIERLIAEDFRFTSPLDNGLNRETYFALCWPNSARIVGMDFISLVRDGDRALVTYEGRTTDGASFRNTEILTVRNGQIVEAEVYFGWSLPHEAPAGGHVQQAP